MRSKWKAYDIRNSSVPLEQDMRGLIRKLRFIEDDYLLPKPNEYSGKPPRFYHYTNLEAALGIIKYGELWASHIAYLNDISERTYGFSLAAQFISSVQPFKYYSILDQLLKISDFSTKGTLAHEDIYLISFSEHRDSVDQWIKYSSGQAKICLGFDYIGDFIDGAGPRRIIYDPDLQKRIMDRLHMETGSSLSVRIENYQIDDPPIQFLLDAYSDVAMQFKKEEWKNEREWRLFITDFTKGNEEFRVRGTQLIPYVPVKIRDGDKPTQIRLAEIVIGPTMAFDPTEKSIRMLLTALQYNNVDVTFSNSSLR